MSQPVRNDFTKGPMWKNILRQAFPMTLAQLINVLYNVVDRMYIGHIPGSGRQALTGLGVTFPIIMMITAFTNWFGTGGAPLCSIARGKGNTDEAEMYMGNSLTLLVAAGIILPIVCFFIMRPVLYAFGASDETYPYASQYLTIYLCGSIFVMVGLGMNNFINAQGFPGRGMLTVAIGAICNIVLDPLFIFVLDMGVRGAALATVLSQAVSALWVMRFLLSSKAILKLRRQCLRLSLFHTKRILALGLSGFTMAMTNSIVQVVCNASLAHYGGDLYVGVMTVINSVREVLFMPVNGITNGSQPVLSFNYGAGRNDRVRQGIRVMSLLGISYAVVVWILVMLFPEPFIRVFTSDADLLRIGPHCMHLYYLGICLMSLQFCGQSVFVSLGKAKRAVFFSLFRKVILVVPLVLLLPRIPALGVDGVFLSEPISDLIGGGAAFTTMLITVYHPLKDHQQV